MIRVRDKAAEKWLREKTASLLNGLGDRWRGVVQNAISAGLAQGLNPRSVGIELAGHVNSQSGRREGGSIELDKNEEDTVDRFKRCLLEVDQAYFEFDGRDKRYDRSVRRSMHEGLPLMGDKINLIVSRFSARLLKNKADLIAQTEMLAALNRSEWLSTRAAFEQSDLPEVAITRIWDTCGDDKVRPSHRSLEGQRIVGFRHWFVSPLTGTKMMYPGDRTMGASEEEVIGCRCRVIYDIDFAAGVD